MKLHVSVFSWCLWTPWRTPRRQSAAGATAGAAMAILLMLPAVGCSYETERGAGESGALRAHRNAPFGGVHAWVHARRHRERDARRSTGKCSTGLLPPTGRRPHPVAPALIPRSSLVGQTPPLGSPTAAPNSATPVAPLVLKVGHLGKHGWGWRGDVFGAPASSPHT